MATPDQGQTPWYQYPRIDNYGVYPDPFGPYPKPDSNILCPAGTPITALLPGTVTGVTYPSWANGGASITVHLDSPINRLATATAYNFVRQPMVSVGQHINASQVLAYSAGTQYGAAMAFALTNEAQYGYGDFSQIVGNPLLNPVPLLDAAANGTLGDTFSSGTVGASGAIGNVLQHINNAISPNEDLANLLEQWDVALGIVNPFNIPMQQDIVVQVPKIGPFGGGTLDTGLPNPGGLSNYVLQVAENIGYDFTALLVRGLFLAVGVGIFMAMGQSLAHQYGQQASDMLGGPEGIAQLAGAFA